MWSCDLNGNGQIGIYFCLRARLLTSSVRRGFHRSGETSKANRLAFFLVLDVKNPGDYPFSGAKSKADLGQTAKSHPSFENEPSHEITSCFNLDNASKDLSTCVVSEARRVHVNSVMNVSRYDKKIII